MKLPGGAFWIAVAFAAGVGNYAVKHMVQGLDDNLTNVRRKIVVEQKQIHDLTAEWTYLNQPELLADLNRHYLGLVPIAPKQERGGIDELAMRSSPPPSDGAPEMQSAAAPPLRPSPPPVAATKLAAAIVPVSAPSPAIVPVTASPPLAAEKPKPVSLDALFEQVAGTR
jgi:hypothetical protein